MTKRAFIERMMNTSGQLMALIAQAALEQRWQWDALGFGASITDEDLAAYGITAADLANAINTIAALYALLTENGNAHAGNLYRVAGTGTTTLP